MKIYTRAGDDGSTGLYGGRRISKASARIACTGEIDELNAALGWCAVAADDSANREGVAIADRLAPLQHELFVIGSHLATPAEDRRAARLPAIAVDAASRLEREIDQAETQLPPLRQFILPGGCELAARLHLARTICRRAERAVVAFAAEEPVESNLLIYLNRLSDWLFVHARLANHLADTPDIPWQKPL